MGRPVIFLALTLVSIGVWQTQACQYSIVESMPDKLQFTKSMSFKPEVTHESLISMIDQAKTSLRIASFYWTLSAEPKYASHPSTEPGRKIMESVEAAAKRGVKIEVILDKSSKKSMNSEDDLDKLRAIGTLKFLNMTRLLKSGVLHSKFLIMDQTDFYLGSSNFDWRSYTQIKEIGIAIHGCPDLSQDLNKIFETYWFMADSERVPDEFPENLKTQYNIDNRLSMNLGSLEAKVFFAAAPPAFNGIKNHWTGRTDDIDGLLHMVDKARHQIDISVMNYNPATEFIWPKKFWPRIDNALRRAATERKVKVRLLFSDWAHNKEEEMMWYRSLNAVQSRALRGGGIHVKMFKVPAFDDFQRELPYSRVKHDKYMVTDKALYIGTSNWAADYFINTCGVSINVEPKDADQALNGTIISNMQELFDRDFNSEFAHELL